MNGKALLIAAFLASVVFISIQSVFAYDPNFQISGGKIRNVCGGSVNDPNCLNTCDVSSGSCSAPSGYSIWVFKCNGVAKRPNTNIFECLKNGKNFGQTTKNIGEFAKPCKTIQMDVVDDSTGAAVDWLVWVSNKQDCDGGGKFEIDVFDVDVNPSSVDEGDDITISGKIKLENAPSGTHTVTVKWFIDGDLKETETVSMNEGDVESVSEDFDTSGFDDGTHTGKIKAIVDSVSDQDSDTFEVEEEDGNGGGEEDLRLGSLDVSPSTICRDDDQLIEFSIPVTLEDGEDDTEILVRFFIEDNDGGFIQVDSQRRNLDDGETRTFTGSFDYDANRFDLSSHDVKAVAENGDSETEFATLRVVTCPLVSDRNVDVGFISLNPEFPNQGEIVIGSVPITLKKATLPENVLVTVKVDGSTLVTTSIHYVSLTTQTLQFTIDTSFLATGTHTVEVLGKVDSVTDKSLRTFTVGPLPKIPTAPQHCLVIEDVWSDRPLRDGESFQITARVRNCGLSGETVTRTILDGFNKSFTFGSFFLSPDKTKDVTFTVFVPDEVFGQTTLRARAFSAFASDSLSKDFIVQSGFPTLNVKSQYGVNECRVNTIKFDIMNSGSVSDTFKISVSGDVASWFTTLPQEVTLESKQVRTIEALVSVPCGTQPGLYQFTLTVKGSPDVSVTSTLKVSKPFTFPRISLPTGLAVSTQALAKWLLLTLLIFLLLVALIAFLAWVLYYHPRREDPEKFKKPPYSRIKTD